jgi:putative lipoprotein
MALSAGAAEPQRPQPPTPSDHAAHAWPIEGPVWRLTALHGFDNGLLPSGPQAVTAQFEQGRVSGFSGCNRYFGAYAMKGGQLVIGPLVGSMMACEGTPMKVEAALHRALAGSFRPVLAADGRLTLVSADGQPALSFQAAPAATLEGFSTAVTGFNNGRQAVVGPKADTTLTVAFGNGIVKGFAGCNTFRATYRTHGDAIAIGPVASTRRLCADPAVMQQEEEFLAALQSTTRWGFVGAMLDMHRADGERTLTGTR